MQYEARRDDDAVGALLLDPGQAGEEFVAHVLSQALLAEVGARDLENFFPQQLLAAQVFKPELRAACIMDLAEVVLEALDLEPLALRRDHAPPGQVVDRGSPQHRLLAPGIHRYIAADAGSVGRGRIDGEYQPGVLG